MGFTPAQLVALRSMAEGFFDTTALVLTPNAELDDLGEPVRDSFTAAVYPARFERRDRLAEQGSIKDARHEIADWQVSMPYTAELSARDLVMPGAGAWAGVWNSGASYGAGDAVKLGARFFVALAATSSALDDTDTWEEAPAFEVTSVNLPASNRVRCIGDLKLLA